MSGAKGATAEDFWSDSDDSDYDYDDDDYYNNDDERNSAVEDTKPIMHSLLEKDIARVKHIYGGHSINHRLYGSIDDMDVDLITPLSFLNNEMARAWRVVQHEPLVVRISLSMSQYLDTHNCPSVEVYQKGKKEDCGIRSQMNNILKNFMSENWKNLSTARVTSEVENKGKSAKLLMPHSTDVVVTNEALSQVMLLGFNAEMARAALIETRGCVNEAADLLFSSPDRFRVRGNYLTDSSPHDLSESSTVFAQIPTHSTTASHSMDKQSLFGKIKSALTSSLSKDTKDSKSIPGLEKGFLVQLMRYINQRLPTLCDYCVVCDQPHLFGNAAMLKPAVCGRELCVFSFQTLGVMSDAAEDIATGSEVVHLLVHMAYAACKSRRRELIFDPYPTVVDPNKTDQLAFNPKHKDYRRVEACLESLRKNESHYSFTDAPKKLAAHDVLAYPLLQWIIASNRSHIVLLPKCKQIKEMVTEHQFLMMSSPPAKEAIFREAKNKHGSTFAFHGSNIENWHSIVRQGLINASGTKYQVNGAAHGKGIYLSPLATLSFGYSGVRRMAPGVAPVAQTGKKSSLFQGKDFVCIALCEVITSPELNKSRNDIWVMPNADHVCTRFFFVYEGATVYDSSINTQNDVFSEALQRALAR